MIRKKLSRFLALVLCLALMLPLFQIPQASALPIGEGVVCSSRYGRNIVGYDGGTYYPRDSFPILYYREDGSTYFQTFTSNGITLQVRFSPDGVQVLSADCADQICVQSGKLTHAGESAVCLPARISVSLLAEDGTSWDAVTG